MANVPTGPTFKATAADAVWTPGRRREEEAEEKERREEAEEERSPVWRPFGAPPDRPPAFRPVGPDRQRDRLVPAASLEKMTQKIESDSANGRAPGPSGRVASGSLSGLPQPLSPTVILLQKAREGQIPKGASYIKVTEEENAGARKCKGIGPTVQGIPLSLRTEVKEEYASDWYKTMYKSLHKFDKSSDDYVAVKYYKKGNIPHDGGYMSEPEVEKEDYSIKYSMDNYEKRSKTVIRDKQIESKNIFLPTSLRSYQEVYKNQPRSITEYEPGHSSISDREERIKIKYLPPLDQPKPSYVYRDGYESDSTLFRRSGKSSSLDPQQQKLWYRKIQQGSDIPFSGLGKPAPERPKKICSCSLCVQRHFLQCSRSLPCQSLDTFDYTNYESYANTSAQSMLTNSFPLLNTKSDYVSKCFARTTLSKSFPVPPCRSSSLWIPSLKTSSNKVPFYGYDKIKLDSKNNYSNFTIKKIDYIPYSFTDNFSNNNNYFKNSTPLFDEFKFTSKSSCKKKLINSMNCSKTHIDDILSKNSKLEQTSLHDDQSNSSAFENSTRTFKMDSLNIEMHNNSEMPFYNCKITKNHKNDYTVDLDSKYLNSNLIEKFIIPNYCNIISQKRTRERKYLCMAKQRNTNLRIFLRNVHEIIHLSDENCKGAFHHSSCLSYHQYITNVIESVKRSQKFLRLKNYYCSLEKIMTLENERKQERSLTTPINLSYLYANLKGAQERGEFFVKLKNENNWGKNIAKELKMKIHSVDDLRETFENKELKLKQTLPFVCHKKLNRFQYSLSVSDLIYKYDNLKYKFECKKLEKCYFPSASDFREKVNSFGPSFYTSSTNENVKIQDHIIDQMSNDAGTYISYHHIDDLYTSLRNFKVANGCPRIENMSRCLNTSSDMVCDNVNSSFECKDISEKLFRDENCKKSCMYNNSKQSLNTTLVPISSEKRSFTLRKSPSKHFISEEVRTNSTDKNNQFLSVLNKLKKNVLICGSVKDKIQHFEKIAKNKYIFFGQNQCFKQRLMQSKLYQNKSSPEILSASTSNYLLMQCQPEKNIIYSDSLICKNNNIQITTGNDSYLMNKNFQNKFKGKNSHKQLSKVPRKILSCCDIRDYLSSSKRYFAVHSFFRPDYIPERTVSSIDLRHSSEMESFQTMSEKSSYNDSCPEKNLVNNSEYKLLNKIIFPIIKKKDKTHLEKNPKLFTGNVQQIRLLFEDRNSCSLPNKINQIFYKNDYVAYSSYMKRKVSTGSVKLLSRKFECLDKINIERSQENLFENIHLSNNRIFKNNFDLINSKTNSSCQNNSHYSSQVTAEGRQEKNKKITKRQIKNSYNFYKKVFPLSYTKYLINKAERRKALQNIIKKFEILHKKNSASNMILHGNHAPIKKSISMWICRDSNDLNEIKYLKECGMHYKTELFRGRGKLSRLKKQLRSTWMKSSDNVSILLPRLIGTPVGIPFSASTTCSNSSLTCMEFLTGQYSKCDKSSGRVNGEEMISSRNENFLIHYNSIVDEFTSFRSKEHKNACSSVSPHKYQETEVNIHYRSPIRNLEKEYIEEEELRKRQETAMKKFYEEEKYKKYLQQLAEAEMRRHSDFFTPSQKSPIPLNRYDNPFELSATMTKTSEIHTMAKVLFNFTAQSSRELSLNKGNLVRILRKIDQNWYEGEHHGMTGIFPANYVEIIIQDNEDMQPKRTTEGIAKVKYNFQAKSALELSLFKGEKVILTRRVDSNWYEGRIGNKKGIFPLSYIEVIKEPDEINSTASLLCKPPSSSIFNTYINGISSNQQLHILQDSSQDDISNGINKMLDQEERPPLTQSLHIDTTNEPIPYKVLYNYKPQNEDELELQERDTVYVLEKCDDGWFVGTSLRTGLFGTFPGNYVERM